MTEAEVKTTLSQYHKSKGVIFSLNSKITELLKEISNTEYLQSPSLSGLPHGNEISDRTYQLVQRQVDIVETSIKRIKKDMDKAEKIITEAEIMRSLLDNVDEYLEWRIIDLRYFCGYEWDAICREMKYKESAVFKTHKKAIDKIVKRLDELKGKAV